MDALASYGSDDELDADAGVDGHREDGALHTAANDDGGGITGAYHFLSPLLSLAFPCFSIYAACSIAAQPK